MDKRTWGVVLAVGLGMWAGLASAQPTNDGVWLAKVDPWVNATARHGQTEFLVFLAEQADLGEAANLDSKEEKGELVVQTLREVAERTQAPILAELARRGVAHRSFWVANMIWVRGSLDTVQAMAERADVARVSANPEVPLRLPDGQLHAPAPDAPEAIEWNITKTGAPSVWALGYKGAGVVVAGQDTGYQWDHPALKGKYRGWNGTAANHNYNWHDGIHPGQPCAVSPTPFDDHGHGTHTMGTMVGDDGGTNQIGMAPQAKWIGCRDMDGGVGTPASYADCFQFFMAPTDLTCQNPDTAKAPHVINNSWGCPPSEGCTDPNVLKTVVENTRAAGIVVVVSAGNSGSGCSTVSEPAAIYDASLTVGATTSTDAIASYSSRGPVTVDGSNRLKPDVSAPGSNIRSSVPGGGYEGGWSGTSMAGPHVAGEVALLLSAMPAWKGQVDLVENRIIQSALGLTSTQTCGTVPGSQIPNNTFGYGRIDALAAVSMADLAIAVTDTPDPVGIGQTLTYRLFPTNQGPATATGVTVELTLPASVTYVSSSSGCGHAAGKVTCDFGSVIKGLFPEKTVTVTTTAAGTLVASATISGTLHDHNSGNNQAFATTTCGSSADLALAKSEPYDPVLAGAPFTYLLTATNNGPSPVAAASIVDTLPANASFVTASPSCTNASGTVTCTAGAIASGGSTAVSVTVVPTTTATMTNTAVVSSELGDPTTSNNSASVTTSVVAAAPVAIAADAHGGTNAPVLASSDLNGVLEPGETVLVEATWRNPSAGPAALTGTASALTGPAGPVYTLTDATSTYGTVAAGASRDCWAAGGDCFGVAVSAPATRPAAHWDLTFTETLSTGATRAWTLHVGDSFTDVPRAHWAYPYVERLLHGGVTTGCPGNRVYCPNDTVPREQMAAFLARGMAGDDAGVPATGSIPGVGDYTCGAGGVSRFTDVPADAWYCRHAHYIWAQDVTTGCDPVNHRFCPADVVPRDQMAVFVARVAAGGEDAVPESYTDPGTGRSYDCGAAGGSHFLDVDDQQWACAHVNYLWALGQIDGCDGPNRLFCPAPGVRRDEMAKFLSNLFGLGLGE